MDKKTSNPLARFERQKLNYPVIIGTVALFGVLICGAVMAISAEAWRQAFLFLCGIFLLGILMLINAANDRRKAAKDDRKFIRWNAAMPELQRQDVYIEVRELAQQLRVDDDQLPDLLSAYIVAEDLALRQMQQDENLPLMRHVSIGSTAFDALIVDLDVVTCVEVSFLVVPDVRQDKIEAMLKKISVAKDELAKLKSRLKLRLMMVLVTQLTAEEEEELRGMLITRRFTDTPVDIDIRLLDFEMLQRVYLSE